MRTAEEISSDVFNNYSFSSYERSALIKLINEARKEAIEECAERAKIIKTGTVRKSVPTGSDFNSVMAHIPTYEVDKQSILNLIKEIK